MKNSELITEEELIADFRKIGVPERMNIMIHSSLSKIGRVIGGVQSVIRELKTVVGEEGTIEMPSATSQCLHLHPGMTVIYRQNGLQKLKRIYPTLRYRKPKAIQTYLLPK